MKMSRYLIIDSDFRIDKMISSVVGSDVFGSVPAVIMSVEFFKMKKIKIPKFLKSVRYNLAAINSLFVLTGLLLLIVGVVMLTRHQDYSELITQRFFTLPGFAIGTGVIILVTSLLGFYAAYSEQFYFIAGYLLLLLVVLIFEIAITSTGYNLRSGTATEIRSTMIQSLQQYEQSIKVARTWDNLQREFQCCGVAGRHDYVSTRIPISCCFIDIGTISPFTCTWQNAYDNGCANELGAWLSQNVFVIAVVALVVTVVQIVLTSAAAWLAWRSKFEEVELEQ